MAYLSVQKLLAGDVPFYMRIWLKLTHPLRNFDLQSIFARSASDVTSSEKNTYRKYTTSFPMSLR